MSLIIWSELSLTQSTEILDLHGKWRRGEQGGARANLARADLAGADLAGADLSGASLVRAYLAGANLVRANLAGANLVRANLAGANLAGANLAGADLAGACLADAYLARANLARADLAGADLAGACLADADLADAYLARANLARADLAGADLAGAYLAGADLSGASLVRAYLAGANLAGAEGIAAPLSDQSQQTREQWVAQRATSREERAKRYREQNPEIPVVEKLDSKILEAVTSGGGKLDMRNWHSCKTTHCRAAWAITLAGEAGWKLEDEVGPHYAGMAIYRASTGHAPHFFASDESALEDIRACAAAENTS